MTPAEIEKADVYVNEDHAGTLIRTTDGAEFRYLDVFIAKGPRRRKVAFHIPADASSVFTHGVNLHPYFAGLLPEGLRLSALTRRLKTSQDDLFSLLIATGDDCIGDVAVVPQGDAAPQGRSLVDFASPAELDFSEVLRQSLDPDTVLDDVSLPGVQSKVSGSMISLPVNAKKRQQSYILKLNPVGKPLLVENEHVFMTIAERCGIKTAATEILRDRNGQTGLLVTRFDRIHEKAKDNPRKVHQEDACQFLNRYPSDKYRITAKEVCLGIDEHATAPIVQKLRFLELAIYSYLIGNGDLHAKNVSLRISPRSGLIEMTPAYDLLSTLPYRGMDQRMAMKIGAKDDELRRRDFLDFASREGIAEDALTFSMDRIRNGVNESLGALSQVGWDPKILNRVQRGITDRLRIFDRK